MKELSNVFFEFPSDYDETEQRYEEWVDSLVKADKEKKKRQRDERLRRRLVGETVKIEIRRKE